MLTDVSGVLHNRCMFIPSRAVAWRHKLRLASAPQPVPGQSSVQLKCFIEITLDSSIFYISLSSLSDLKDGVKELPLHDKSNCFFLKGFILTAAQRCCPFIFFFLIGPSLYTSSCSHSACETKLTAWSTVGKWMCTKPPVACGEQKEGREKKLPGFLSCC